MVIRLFRLRADLRKHHYFLGLRMIVLHSRMFICFPLIGIAPPIDSDFYLTATVPALSKIKELLVERAGTFCMSRKAQMPRLKRLIALKARGFVG